jgi:hypothetical protein
MSTARHHAEWLSLVEASGPFLSLPVLLKVFAAGLDAHDPEHLKLVRSAHEEWQDNQFGLRPERAIHWAWVEFVLKRTLELPDEVLQTGQQIPSGLLVTVAEHNETLKPDWVVVNPSGVPNAGQPRLLVQCLPPDQNLEKQQKGSRWAASPATRMMELLHATNVRLRLITNGEHWMLVNAPKGETSGFISWYSTLWLDEHLTLRAFRSLLGVRRFFGVDDSETLEAMLSNSLKDQQEVTDQLGYQVRRAVEVLVQAIARLDQDQNGSLLKDIAESRLYEAVLTVMMRLVFLFCAEERGLLLLGDPIYDQHYAVSTLREQLRTHAGQYGEEVLERRSDAWCRLLATFRAVYGGIFHDTLQLPAYGGSLFDPDRFPFLEGRSFFSNWQDDPADPLRVNNRIVLHLLEALQILQIRVPGGGIEPRRLSFRALDIEQIGHVYEGLLDHTAVRATSPVLGLVGTRLDEPEIELAKLEELDIQGSGKLLEYLKEQTKRSLPALTKALNTEVEASDLQRLRTACNNDAELFERVRVFAGLIREDTLGYPVVIPTGSVYVTQGATRRQTGTHYTPRSLTEEIVQYTLEPLVYEGPAEGKAKEDWRLKSAAELLQLKICDIAMGSGAFLVQTCRYMAERLVEAWEQAERENPGQVVVAPEGTLSAARPDECPIPHEPEERMLVARRIVADRCLYGVDINPLAVEMAKLSLWLVTLAKGRPFTFLDHSFKCGDSLLGITRPEQIEFLSLNPDKEAVQLRTVSDRWKPFVQRAIAKRQELENFSVSDIADVHRKEQLFREAEEAIGKVRYVGDFLVAEALAQAGKTSDLTDEELQVIAEVVIEALNEADAKKRERDITAILAKTKRMMNLGNPENQQPRKPFHWLLEFPEVFLEGETKTKGFSAILGNPPFRGGTRISSDQGRSFIDWLSTAFEFGGDRTDLIAYFFQQAWKLTKADANVGLIASNSISETDTRKASLDLVIGKGGLIFRAESERKWAGDAGVTVSIVYFTKNPWQNIRVLNGETAFVISTTLTASESSKPSEEPKTLIYKFGYCGMGSKPYGDGFLLNQEEARQLLNDSKNKEIIFPYLGGEDIVDYPDSSPQRFVINFKQMSLDECFQYSKPLEIVVQRVKPHRDPDTDKLRREKWWQFERHAKELYKSLDGISSCLVTLEVAKYLIFVWQPTNIVFASTCIVVATNLDVAFAILQSSIHEVWARRPGLSKLETRPRYNPEKCYRTFPIPKLNSNQELSTYLSSVARNYNHHRNLIAKIHFIGQTEVYNRFHDQNETASDIQKLRSLHIEMDQAVAAAYGWQDLDLRHCFYKSKRGDLFTISETARQEVLDRLLKLNHQRYAEEVAQGLHDKGKKKGKEKTTKDKKATVKPDSESEQITLF